MLQNYCFFLYKFGECALVKLLNTRDRQKLSFLCLKATKKINNFFLFSIFYSQNPLAVVTKKFINSYNKDIHSLFSFYFAPLHCIFTENRQCLPGGLRGHDSSLIIYGQRSYLRQASAGRIEPSSNGANHCGKGAGFERHSPVGPVSESLDDYEQASEQPRTPGCFRTRVHPISYAGGSADVIGGGAAAAAAAGDDDDDDVVVAMVTPFA